MPCTKQQKDSAVSLLRCFLGLGSNKVPWLQDKNSQEYIIAFASNGANIIAGTPST